MDSQTSSQQNPTNSSKELLKPWKVIGYRGFSAFLASDNDFLVFRRFGALNARLLLQLQDEIAVREEMLGKLEATHASAEAKDIHNGSFRQEALPERSKFLSEIYDKVKQYNKLLIQHSTLRSQPKVPEHHINSITAWLHNTQNAILDEERGYIYHTHDLFQLVPTATTPLRRLLERSERFRLAKLWKKKTPKHAHEHYPYPETLQFYSNTNVDRFVSVTITVLGMIMLVTPLWVLAITHGTMKRLGVITGFIIVFLALIALTTVARPFESLAAAAAYSAVLVVFLQISS